VADHTVAIRMQVLADAVNLLGNQGTEDTALVSDLTQMLSEHVRLAAGQELYRPKSNHGLMMDHSLLYVSLLLPKLDPAHRYASHAESRALDQIDWLFTAEGVTREHSISYQEYNCGICMDILHTCRRFDYNTVLSTRLEAILRSSQLLLSHAIKPNGEFPMVGDSFPTPVGRYYDRMRVLLTGLDPQLEYAISAGKRGTPPTHELLAFPEGGFGILRQGSTAAGSPDVAHCFFTAAWHSYIHKQEDDLSFTFYALGRDIVIDPGYSDAFSKTPRGQWVRTAAAHSVVTSPSAGWAASSTSSLFESTRLTGYAAEPGALGLRGEHRRIDGTKVVRVLALIRPRLLFLVDFVEAGLESAFRQSVHLAPGIRARSSGGETGLLLVDRQTGATLGRMRSLANPEALLIRERNRESGSQQIGPIVARRNEFLDSSIVVMEKNGADLTMPLLVQAASEPSEFVSNVVVDIRGQANIAIQYREGGIDKSLTLTIHPLATNSGVIRYGPKSQSPGQ
jgi:hypothetical protein